MRVLIDTNVLLDDLMGRQPFYDFADRIIKLCSDRKIEGRMAAHSVPNMFYILRKNMTDNELREALKNICQIVKVEGIDSFKIFAAIDNKDFRDFEDRLQEECAVSMAADLIITRNIADFSTSRVPAIMPDEFLEKYISE